MKSLLLMGLLTMTSLCFAGHTVEKFVACHLVTDSGLSGNIELAYLENVFDDFEGVQITLSSESAAEKIYTQSMDRAEIEVAKENENMSLDNVEFLTDVLGDEDSIIKAPTNLEINVAGGDIEIINSDTKKIYRRGTLCTWTKG